MSRNITVSNNTELEFAISNIQDGDRILLESGTYSGFKLKDLPFDVGVNIESVDSENVAIIDSKVEIFNCHNVSIRNINFDCTDIDVPYPNGTSNSILVIDGSKSISVLDNSFVGGIADQTISEKNIYMEYGYGRGVFASNSENVEIGKNEFLHLYKAINLDNMLDTNIFNNHFNKIRVDGIGGTDLINTTIFENLFQNFKPYRLDPSNPSGITDDHSDMIQYWGTGADFGIIGFSVKDNVIIQSESDNQSIFGGLNVKDGHENTVLTDFEISGNLIINGSRHGISIDGVNNAIIHSNTVIPNSEVIEEFRNIPDLRIKFRPEMKNVDAFGNVVSNQMEVYDNVVAYRFKPEITLGTASDERNNREEIIDDLNLNEGEQIWISAQNTNEFNFFEKFGFYSGKSSLGETVIVSAMSHEISDGGSEYLQKNSNLESFFDNLNTTEEFFILQTNDWQLSIEELDRIVYENLPVVHSDPIAEPIIDFY